MLWLLLGASLVVALGALVWTDARRRTPVLGLVAAALVLAAAFGVTSLWIGNPHTDLVTSEGRERVMCQLDSVSTAFPGRDDRVDATCQRHARERVAGGAALWVLALGATAVVVRRRVVVAT